VNGQISARSIAKLHGVVTGQNQISKKEPVMKALLKSLVLSVVAIQLGALSVGQASATSVSHVWTVANVPWDDVLNIRAYPANHSRKIGYYDNGDAARLTGRCTGHVNLDAIAHWPAWKQRKAVRYQWCETVQSTNYGHGYTIGWVYGRYIVPNQW
jgi:hypothetical protein